MDDQRETFFEEDERYPQCRKEMWLSVAFFFVNLLVLGGSVLVLTYGESAEEVRLVAGFPAWFLYGLVGGSIVLIILAYLMVKLFFKEMPLGPLGGEDEEGQS